jgi:methionine-rich copper-binding protein CopC
VARKDVSILPTLATDYMPADGGGFETDNGHFLPVSTSGNLTFQRGNSTVTGKNGTAAGSFAYVTGLTATTYPIQANAYLYTPNYNFATTGTYTLSFKTKYAVEANYDGFLVEYTTNKGTSWTKLGTAIATDWYNATVPNNVGMGGFPATTKIFSGTSSSFQTKTFDASALAGNANVAFRFVFKADDINTDAGVAIDDFQIVGPFIATTFLPANNATAVALNQDLQITFTRAVSKGTGNIVIKKVSDNTVVETIAVTSANVTVAGSVATINPTNDLPTGIQVYVEIASGAFKDVNNVVYTGFTGSTNWKFTTVSDLIAPTLVSLNPANNATGVITTANLIITLSENVKKGTGNITIKKVSDNSIVENIPVANANITIAEAVVTINPTNELASLTDYYVEIANGAIQDIANNNYVGFTGNTTWKFTTATETTPPTALSFNPAHNSINVTLTADLVITFSEDVKKGTGNIVIRKTSDNTAVETIAVTNANVTIAGVVVTINPNDFVANTGYYVEISAGAIQDIASNNFAGITGSTTWAFTSLDNVVPTLVTLSPANNATNANIGTDLTMTFNENIKKGGVGSIRIRKVSDNSTVETIDVTNTSVTVANATLTINPANNLAYFTEYYVEVDNGFIQDLASNNYAGFTGNTSWKFTTANETTPPTALTFSPANGSTNVALATDLVITFSENVKKGTVGNVLIKRTSDNTIAQTIAITDVSVTIAGAVATINPATDLTANTGYYIEVTAGAIQDIAGNNFAGITGNSTWGFTSLDTTAPLQTAFNPTNNATNFAGASNLSITFNENVKKGTGNIVIKKVSDNTVFETIAITSANVTIANTVVTINPTTNLTYNTAFYVEVANGAIQDIAGNNYIGFTGNTTWKFTTDFSTAIERNAISDAITIYPNPTEKYATLRVTKGLILQEATLRIINSAGKMLWTTQSTQLAETQSYDWSNIPAGKYFLEITTKQGKAVKAIIKQ